MFSPSLTFVAAVLLAPVLAVAQTTTTTTTTTTTNAPVTPPTIETVISDMSTPSEAMVIDPRYDFQYKATIIQYSPSGTSLPSWWTGTRPEWCYRALTWFTAYEAQGNAATNTRVQLRDLRMYVLSNRTRTWTRYDLKSAPNTELWKYPFVYAGGTDKAGVRTEATGGISIKPAYPLFHHGYGTTSVVAEPSDVRAVYVAMEFRLVVDNPSIADDREKARYVVNAGADYYPGNGLNWGVGYAPGIGGSKYMLAKNEWRTAAMLIPNKLVGSNWTDMQNNVPPLTLASQ